MKKVFIVALAAMGIATLIPAQAEVISGPVYEGESCKLFWAYDTGTKVLTFTGEGGIPDNLLNQTPWDAYRMDIESIVFPAGLTSIGNYAFHGFTTIKKITLPENLSEIGQYSFYGCINLHEFHMGSNVATIAQYALAGCCSLTSLAVPNSATDIKYRAFDFVPNIVYSDTRLDAYGARTVNGYVENDFVYTDNTKQKLSACSAVQTGDITIDAAVKEVLGYAFKDCIHLTSVTFGDNMEKLGEYAFFGSENLVSVTFGTGLKELARYAVQCPNLKTVHCNAAEVPSTSSYAFYEVNQKKAKLYVPQASLEAYKAAAVWKEFGSILAEGTTGIGQVPSDQVPSRKVLRDGRLVITQGDKIYTATGQELR